VFEIGESIYNSLSSKHVNILINLFNKGKKFIPCFHLNNYHFHKNLLNNFEIDLTALNKSFLFSKLYQKSNNNKNPQKIPLNPEVSDEIVQELNQTNSDDLDLSNINHDECIKKIFRSEINKNKKYDIQNELMIFN
jgi:hypothetical protein